MRQALLTAVLCLRAARFASEEAADPRERRDGSGPSMRHIPRGEAPARTWAIELGLMAMVLPAFSAGLLIAISHAVSAGYM